jgi:WD40 repeat protein
MRSLPLICLGAAVALAVSGLTSVAISSPLPLKDVRGVLESQLNHDGSRVFLRLRDGGAGIWDAATGAAVAGELPPTAVVVAHVVSPDGTKVLVGFEEGSQVFDFATAAAVSPLLDVQLQRSMVQPAVFSPDGEVVVIFGEAETGVWRTRTGEALAKFPAPPGEYEEVPPSAIFAADGAVCFIMDRQGTVTRYEAQSWKAVGRPMRHPAAEMAYEFGFAASADGKWLATFDHPGENGPKAHLQLWDAAAQKPLGKPAVAVNGFGAEFFGGNRVLVLPKRGDATVRELPSARTLFKTRPHDDVDGPEGTLTPDGQWVLTWGADRRLDCYDAATGKLSSNHTGSAQISEVVVAPDSSAAFVVFDNSAFPANGFYDHYIARLSLPDLRIAAAARITEPLHRTALSRDGQRILVQHGPSDAEAVTILETATMTVPGAAGEQPQ